MVPVSYPVFIQVSSASQAYCLVSAGFSDRISGQKDRIVCRSLKRLRLFCGKSFRNSGILSAADMVYFRSGCKICRAAVSYRYAVYYPPGAKQLPAFVCSEGFRRERKSAAICDICDDIALWGKQSMTRKGKEKGEKET